MLKINLILAGGGVRFGAYIGALYALKEEGGCKGAIHQLKPVTN